MNKVKTIVLAMLAGVLLGVVTASANANPLVVAGIKAVYELGKQASREAVEKAVKESGGKLSREALEKIGREAAERGVREAGEKAIKEAFEQGVRQTGGRLSREALEKAFSETMEHSNRAAIEKAAREVAKETAQEALEKIPVKVALNFHGSGATYISRITADGSLVFSRNPGDAIAIPRYLAEKIAVKMRNNGWGIMVDSVNFIP